MAPLQRTLAWYEGARVAMQSIEGVLDADFTRGEQQTAQRVLQRAFDAARARATLMDRRDRAESSNAPTRQTRAARVAKLRATIAREEQGVKELRARLSSATAAARPSLERQLTAANNRFDLARTRLDFLTKFGQADAAVDDEVDLADQVRALQDAVPELGATTAPTTVVTTDRRLRPGLPAPGPSSIDSSPSSAIAVPRPSSGERRTSWSGRPGPSSTTASRRSAR